MLGTGNVRAAIYLGPTNHVLLEKFGEKRGIRKIIVLLHMLLSYSYDILFQNFHSQHSST